MCFRKIVELLVAKTDPIQGNSCIDVHPYATGTCGDWTDAGTAWSGCRNG